MGFMKWNFASIKQYLEVKEYVDTALIPLIELDLDDMLSASLATEYVSAIAVTVEDQLRGRLLLFPMLTYVKGTEQSAVFNLMNAFSEKLRAEGLKNVLFLTQNDEWGNRQVAGRDDILVVEKMTQDMTEVNSDQLKPTAQKVVSNLIEKWQKG
jgi:hypothetical protein